MSQRSVTYDNDGLDGFEFSEDIMHCKNYPIPHAAILECESGYDTEQDESSS